MATGTVTAWNPYGVSMNLKAVSGTVTRTSATKFTVNLTTSWEVYYSGNKTNYGMKAVSGGVTKVISVFGTKHSSGSASFTGTYTISGNGAATKSITVTFTNYEEDWKGNVTKSSSKSITLSVSVPAWTSYTVSYNANGGSGAPAAQTKWKDQTLTLTTSKPTGVKTGHTFSKWNTAAAGNGTSYNPGAAYTANANATLYAQWTPNTYKITFNANGGTGGPTSQTKTYGVALTLSSTIPTRTNYNFLGWSTSSTATSPTYKAGGSYTNNSNATLYAVWQLAYKKPRITNFSVDRCNSSGTATDDGTYILVKFNWACDKTVSSIKIQWKLSTASSYSNSVTVSASNTSGSVTGQIIGSGTIDTDHAYDVYVTVTDGGGSSYKTGTVAGLKFIIDLLSGGDGIGFGKPAEVSGLADFGFQVRFGAGILQPVLGNGTDLNNVTIPNIYAGNAATTAGYLNCPVTTATSFTLEVMSAGGSGQLMQRITSCTKGTPIVYVRHYYSSAWGDWITM